VDTNVLNDIPFQLDIAHLAHRLHIKKESGYAKELERLAQTAQTIGRPKALYKAAFVDSRDDNHVVVEGVTLTSRVLRVNLEQAHRVFPFVATCGMELEEWARSIDDVLQRYWAETIKEIALRSALQAMNDHLAEHYRPGKTSAMSPGSLADWPIQEQRMLFTLLGDTQTAIGVYLTDSLLMIPTKSVSGIRFPTETDFESCRLCPRSTCPGRRAPYDPNWRNKYQLRPES